MSAALAFGCADSREQGAANTTSAAANVAGAASQPMHDPAAPHSNDAGSQHSQDSGASRSNDATSQLDGASECPRSAPGTPLFGVLNRDENNSTWLWGVSYTGAAKVGGFIGTRRIITFDEPAMMGRQLEIESTSSVVRGLQMGQSLWVVLRGSNGPYAPSLSFMIFRESEGGSILFASYGADPATRPTTAPSDPDLLGFTISIADGCHAMVPPDMACFEDSVRTQLLVTAHADKDIDLDPARLARIELGGDPYDLQLIAAERIVGGAHGHCSDAVQGTFLGFQVVAAGP